MNNMGKVNTTQNGAPKQVQPNLSDPQVRAERRAAAEKLVRSEQSRRRERRISARSA